MGGKKEVDRQSLDWIEKGFNTNRLRKIVRKKADILQDGVTVSVPLIVVFFMTLIIMSVSVIFFATKQQKSITLQEISSGTTADIQDIDQYILKTIRIDGNQIITQSNIYQAHYDIISESLEKLPDRLKRNFAEQGGYINLSTLDGEKGETGIYTQQNDDGTKTVSNVIITLTPTENNITHAIMHEFGHFAIYDSFGKTWSESLIPNYNHDVDRFIKEQCEGLDYYRDKAEYSAEMFEYMIQTDPTKYEYKDAYAMKDFLNISYSK